MEAADFDVPLNLDRLPRNAAALRTLAERIAIVMALALTDGDTDSVPVSVGLVGRLMGLDPRNKSHRGRAWRQREALRRRQIIRWDRRTESTREGWEGTDCFQPYDFDLAAVFESGVDLAEVRQIPQEAGGVDPDVEVGDELAVDRAEHRVAATRPVGVITPSSGAGLIGHDADDNRAIGGRDRSDGTELVALVIELFDAVELSAEP